MDTVKSICLCCAVQTTPKERRVLRSESNCKVIPLLKSLIQRVLVNTDKKPDQETDVDGVLLGDYNSSGYVCRSYQTLLVRYYTADSLLQNLLYFNSRQSCHSFHL